MTLADSTRGSVVLGKGAQVDPVHELLADGTEDALVLRETLLYGC
jgi:hypothetical protein